VWSRCCKFDRPVDHSVDRSVDRSVDQAQRHKLWEKLVCGSDVAAICQMSDGKPNKEKLYNLLNEEFLGCTSG